ncbi:TolB family protein [Marinigracilibium pacificum]|uniref:WD40 repeat protein n=1 Tax=Marinigracilibium pacificum TaxID=2729599 RepID=A0A848J2C3_9BACT|nr:PD40 domain-containing protein [Marinigracilibium pacificum]NMM49655.1 hypothetical protein [Marinigracilibium pacificum]
MRLFKLAILFFIPLVVQAQQVPQRPVSRNINIPNNKHIAPALRGDGSAMIYTSSYSPSLKLELMYSEKTSSGWSKAEPIEVINATQNLNFIGGYSLAFDGESVFFTSSRGSGFGGYDMYEVDKQGGYWMKPRNLGKPINSELNEGSPSISPDGRTIYFMRCEEMDNVSGSGCKLMMAQRRGGTYWHDPTPMPDHINVGNSMNPRILSDNQTLIFSSDRPGGKGGMDLYLTRYEDGVWTDPVNIDAINTAGDDLYADVPGKGDVIYFNKIVDGLPQIWMAKLPREYQPSSVVFVDGRVVDGVTGSPMEAFVQVYRASDRKLITNDRSGPTSGLFELFVTGGETYDFSVSSFDPSYMIFARPLVLDTLTYSLRERKAITLEPIVPGKEYWLYGLGFKNESDSLNELAFFDLERVIKTLKGNRNWKANLSVYLKNYKKDSVKSSPDLTQEMYDTTMVSRLAIVMDSLDITGPEELSKYLYDSVSSDTSRIYFEVEKMIDNMEVVTFYTNDRRENQAQMIRDYLIKRGVPQQIWNVEVSPLDEEGNQQPEYPTDYNKDVWIRIRFDEIQQ